MIVKNLKSKLFSTLIIITLLLPCLVSAPAMAVVSYPFLPDDDEVANALNYLRDFLTYEPTNTEVLHYVNLLRQLLELDGEGTRSGGKGGAKRSN